MLVRRIQISYLRVTLNAILGIRSTIARLWIVMMKLTCLKWIWVAEQNAIFTGGTLRWRKSGRDNNDQKEAMPKVSFQFGLKMQDGRKTRKQNQDQKITNELLKINKILARKKMERRERIMKMVGTMMMTCSLVRSCGYEKLNLVAVM